jgi:cytochrome c556
MRNFGIQVVKFLAPFCAIIIMVSVSSSANADPIKDRRAIMKAVAAANKNIRDAAKRGDISTAIENAKSLVEQAEKFLSLFPPGTGRDKLDPRLTRSKPEIWSNWEEFKSANAAMISAARVVMKGDMSGVPEVGGTCAGCHRNFRGAKVR